MKKISGLATVFLITINVIIIELGSSILKIDNQEIGTQIGMYAGMILLIGLFDLAFAQLFGTKDHKK